MDGYSKKNNASPNIYLISTVHQNHTVNLILFTKLSWLTRISRRYMDENDRRNVPVNFPFFFIPLRNNQLSIFPNDGNTPDFAFKADHQVLLWLPTTWQRNDFWGKFKLTANSWKHALPQADHFPRLIFREFFFTSPIAIGITIKVYSSILRHFSRWLWSSNRCVGLSLTPEPLLSRISGFTMPNKTKRW